MKIVLLATFGLFLLPSTVSSQSYSSASSTHDIVPPEIVQCRNVHVDGDVKTVTVGNANRHYSLSCNVKAAGCITPEPNKNYLLFNKGTRWKMPGAKDFISLAFVQDWTVKYNEGENIGLVPEQGGSPDELGVFLLDTTGGGYEQDTIISDGPIIYGTGLSTEDRRKAWKHFFMLIVEACIKQQGKDAFSVKLARRCQSGDDFCTVGIDAYLAGIGGIQEPRKVLVLLATDLHDQNKLLSRMVCTWPAKGKQVCRDWDTGKLMTGDNGSNSNPMLAIGYDGVRPLSWHAVLVRVERA